MGDKIDSSVYHDRAGLSVKRVISTLSEVNCMTEANEVVSLNE